MFSARQMTYLAYCQWQDDWHVSYFVTVVKEYHTSPINDLVKSARLEQAEFDDLLAILSRADQEDIFNLQCALNSLNLLPCTMFKPSALTQTAKDSSH